MTPRGKVSYTKRCIKFLGAKRFDDSEEYELYGIIEDIEDGKHEKHFFEIKDMKFHSDWNWIMEVIEAIEKKFGEAPLFKEVYQEWLCEDIDACDFLIFKFPKEKTIKAINNFFIWHEQNQN